MKVFAFLCTFLLLNLLKILKRRKGEWIQGFPVRLMSE